MCCSGVGKAHIKLVFEFCVFGSCGGGGIILSLSFVSCGECYEYATCVLVFEVPDVAQLFIVRLLAEQLPFQAGYNLFLVVRG